MTAAGATAMDGENLRRVVVDDSDVAPTAVQGDEPGGDPTDGTSPGGGRFPPAGGGGSGDGGGPLPATVVSGAMRTPPPVFPSPSNDSVRHVVLSSSLVHVAPASEPPSHEAPPAVGTVTDTRVTPAPWPASPFGTAATGGGGGGGGSSGGDSGGRGSGPAASHEQGNSEDDHNTIQRLTAERDGLLRSNGSLAHRNARARAAAADAAAAAAATQAAASAHVADLQRGLARAQAARARDADVAHAVADELDRFRLMLETDSVRLLNEQEAHRQRLCLRLGTAAGAPRTVRRVDTSRGVDVALAAVCEELEARMLHLEATVEQRVAIAVAEAMGTRDGWGDVEGRHPRAADGGGGGGDGRGGGAGGRGDAAAESRRVATWPPPPARRALRSTEEEAWVRGHDNGAPASAPLTYPSAAASRAGGRRRDGGRAVGGGPPSPPPLPHRETAMERRPDGAPPLPLLPLLPSLPAEGPLVPGGSSSTGTPPAPADAAEAATVATDDSAAVAWAA